MFLNNLKRKTRSFSVRLSFYYTSLFLLSFFALFFVGYFLLKRALIQKDEGFLREELQEYADIYTKGGIDAVAQQYRDEDTSFLVKHFLVRIVAPHGKELFTGANKEFKGFALLLNKNKPTSHNERLSMDMEEGAETLDVGAIRTQDGNFLQIGFRTTDRIQLLKTYTEIFTWISGLAALLSLFVGYFLSTRALQPMNAIKDELSEIISGGDFTKRISVSHAGDEFSEMQEFLNELVAKIDALLDAMRSSIDNLAHEMRSPLTRFRSSAEKALLAGGDSRLLMEALETCTEEASHLLELVTTIMDISELESGARVLQKSSHRLEALVEQVADLHEIEAEQKNIKVVMSIPSAAEIYVDRTRFLRALSNLIANAIKYSPPDSTIEIMTKNDGDTVEISVKDNGLGISEDHIGKIWTRLYRVDTSRTTSGLGLGLSIVKSIVEAHRGAVQVQSVVGKGSVFTMGFPQIDRKPETLGT